MPTPTREELELETIKANSPYALPDDTAASGWTTAQVKEKFYAGLLYLYDLFGQSRKKNEDDISDISDRVGETEGLVATFIAESKADKDGDGNVIKETYAKISDLANGTVGVLRYIDGDGTLKDVKSIDQNARAGIASIQSLFSEGAALRAVSADKATADANGSNIIATYATKAENLATNALAQGIIDGANTAHKAIKDSNGNVISSTYETKADATAKVARSNLVSIVGEATQSLSGLLSSTDKARIDMLYNILVAGTESNPSDVDTVVNTFSEILAVFSAYPEGVTIVDALATKVGFSDVINNLTSNEISKPLSAYQGKVLKAAFDDLAENTFTRDELFNAAMFSVSNYNSSTGELTIEYSSSTITNIAYNSSTGEVTFTY